MPNRFRAALIASLTIASSLLAAAPVGAVATPQKVVIIVGPTGALTDNYRSKGDAIAAAAQAAGATAVKVYSPNATWANVKAAVNGANIVVYLGHGNGYPNPYGSTELTDRANGWGLNRTTTNGDGDNWGSTMVYCGEKALMGTLTSASTAQWTYCGGSTNTDGITPAANWVMIYSNACYAPGASEGWDVPATEAVALQRVRNYSYPGLMVGGGAYFATDMYQGAPQLVDTILRNPGMAFGAIAEKANGYTLSRQRHFDHPDLPGRRIWIQNTGTATSGDYFFAYSGKLGLTPSGTTVAYTEPVPPPIDLAPTLVARQPAVSATGVGLTPTVTARFSEAVTGVGTSSMVLSKTADLIGLAATVSYDPGTMTATLQPSAPLLPNTTYRVAMSGWIKDLGGTSLAWTTWNFTTQSGAPTLVARQPASSATNVSLSTTITARFSEAVTGVSTSSMVLSKTVDLIGLAATLSYDPGTMTATLQPSAPLLPNTTYRVAMSGWIKDLAGNALPWTWWTFTTGPS